MRKFIYTVFVLMIALAMLPSQVFAAGTMEYTIDVRNRTGAPVELNYTDLEGVLHWVTIPVGVSKLTLTEGEHSYWADPQCGHIAGTMNLTQQRQILWISCDHAIPILALIKPVAHSGKISVCGTDYGLYYTLMGGTVTLFFSQTNWFSSINTWEQIEYYFSDPVGSDNEVNPYAGIDDGPAKYICLGDERVDNYYSNYADPLPPVP